MASLLGLSRFWLLSVLLTAGCAGQPWVTHTMPGCAAPLASPSLEQERAYLAVLLGLDTRAYAVTRAKLPDVEAETGVGDGRTRWFVRATPTGTLQVDVPPDTPLSDRRTESRFLYLSQSTAFYRCRELEWLRWEAQNRGLVPIGVAAAGPSSGGELDAMAGDEQTPAMLGVVASRHERDEQIRQLEEMRMRQHMGRKIAFAAVSAALSVTGTTLMLEALLFRLGGCQTLDYGFLGSEYRDCTQYDLARPLAIAGASLAVVGVSLIGVSFPRLFAAIRRRKELGREIKGLRASELSLGASTTPFGLSFRGSF